MKKKLVVLLVFLALVGSVSAAVNLNDVYWNGTGNWMDSANWTETVGDGGEWGIPGWVAGNTNIGNGTANDGSYNWNKGYAVIQSGTVGITSASKPDQRVERLYVAGGQVDVLADLATYRVYANSGTMNISSNIGCTYAYTTPGSNESLTVNHTAGTFTVGSKAYFGAEAGVDNSAVNYNLSGGTLDVSINIMYMGRAGGPNSSFTLNQTGGTYNSIITRMGSVGNGEETNYTMSGGSLNISKYIRLYNDSTFSVVGSGADSIRTRQMVVDAGTTLSVALDADGSTLIEVYGDGVESGFESYNSANLSGSTLDLSTLAGFDGQAGDIYDILWAATTIDATGLLMDNAAFSYAVVDATTCGYASGQVLQVTVIPEPATMMLLITGLAFVARKRK